MFTFPWFNRSCVFALLSILSPCSFSAEAGPWTMRYASFADFTDIGAPNSEAWFNERLDGWYGPFELTSSNPNELCDWYVGLERIHAHWSGHTDGEYGANPPGGEYVRLANAEIDSRGHVKCEIEWWFIGGYWREWSHDAYATPNPCHVSPTFGCGKSVEDLKRAPEKAEGDPTSLFHKNQICIAEKSCPLRCSMDNCKWIDMVVPDFIDPYVKKEGEWKTIEDECRNSMLIGWEWAARTACGNKMATYHIREDLISSLVKNGCGSDGDWDAIYNVIKQCNKENVGEAQGLAANILVKIYRNNVRKKCLELRSGAGLPTPIGEGLGGKICFVD